MEYSPRFAQLALWRNGASIGPFLGTIIHHIDERGVQPTTSEEHA